MFQMGKMDFVLRSPVQAGDIPNAQGPSRLVLDEHCGTTCHLTSARAAHAKIHTPQSKVFATGACKMRTRTHTHTHAPVRAPHTCATTIHFCLKVRASFSTCFNPFAPCNAAENVNMTRPNSISFHCEVVDICRNGSAPWTCGQAYTSASSPNAS